jgi:hypothetical protein
MNDSIDTIGDRLSEDAGRLGLRVETDIEANGVKVRFVRIADGAILFSATDEDFMDPCFAAHAYLMGYEAGRLSPR